MSPAAIATADTDVGAVTARLAAFVAQADAAAIPEAVLHEGRRCLVNLFGVALPKAAGRARR
jgi:hypothetical protein